MVEHEMHRFWRRVATAPAVALSLATLSGCVMWMRDADYYGDELTELLEGREDAVAACYDAYLSAVDPTAPMPKGQLQVEFDVQKKTGEITNIEIVADQTTVAQTLAACVTEDLAALRLDPPDARTARASFAWEFALGSPKRPPADPFADAQAEVLGCYAEHLATVDREAQGDVVVDYAFDRGSGAVARVEVIADSTTAAAPVVECVVAALRSTRIEPEKLDERNATGRRSFALRYEPYQE